MLQIVMLPIGQTLYLWRLRRGFTQAELAKRSGIPRPNLSMMEQGGRDVTLSTLRRLAHSLGVRPGILADGISPEPSPKKRWSREELDRLARYLKGERISLSTEEKKIAEIIQPLIQRKVALQIRQEPKAPPRRGFRRQRRLWLTVKTQMQPQELNNLLSRLTKVIVR